MINFLKKNYQLLAICLISLIMFYPSLTTFYTNDDFYFLNISQTDNVREFISFFDISRSQDGLFMYRPLTIHAFYIISLMFFESSPLPLHVISFIFLFGIIYLIYKLVILLVEDKKIALISAFLYATSATHFAHLYYLATFQELGMTFFVLLSCLTFINGRKITSLLYFILALMSKETAIVTPFLITLIYFYINDTFNKTNIKRFIYLILPFFALTAFYLFAHFSWFGVATGDSYVWDFSIRKLINTMAWYVLWALNLPETIIDFIGPGLKVNPNLLIYWSREIVPITILFFVQVLLLMVTLIKSLFRKNESTDLQSNKISTLSLFWFVAALVPVAFLPVHKFAFYLTLPLIGFVIRIGYLLVKTRMWNLFIIIFLTLWTVLSLLTLKHTVDTSWITRGQEISERVKIYFDEHQNEYVDGVTFKDTPNDLALPWSPTQVVKVALSDKNFFYTYFPGLVDKVSYFEGSGVPLNSRQFLAY